jgi:hypothetical protein
MAGERYFCRNTYDEAIMPGKSFDSHYLSYQWWGTAFGAFLGSQANHLGRLEKLNNWFANPTNMSNADAGCTTYCQSHLPYYGHSRNPPISTYPAHTAIEGYAFNYVFSFVEYGVYGYDTIYWNCCCNFGNYYENISFDR